VHSNVLPGFGRDIPTSLRGRSQHPYGGIPTYRRGAAPGHGCHTQARSISAEILARRRAMHRHCWRNAAAISSGFSVGPLKRRDIPSDATMMDRRWGRVPATSDERDVRDGPQTRLYSRRASRSHPRAVSRAKERRRSRAMSKRTALQKRPLSEKARGAGGRRSRPLRVETGAAPRAAAKAAYGGFIEIYLRA
jgi:hypothetical protein